jgi:hypothetical protein
VSLPYNPIVAKYAHLVVAAQALLDIDRKQQFQQWQLAVAIWLVDVVSRTKNTTFIIVGIVI